MNIYLSILKEFLSYNFYATNYSRLDLESMKKDHPEIYRLFACLPRLHKSGENKTYSLLDFKAVVMVEYPKIEEGLLDQSIELMKGDPIDSKVCDDFINAIHTRSHALSVARLAVDVAEGRKDYSEIPLHVAKLQTQTEQEHRDNMVSDNLADLLEESVKERGFRWRLHSMNRHLGSLRKGDFGFLFARPEAGKTTFLASEITHFSSQIGEDMGPILWFNNEEQGNKVMIRCYQAALGISYEELIKNSEKYKEEYFQVTHGKLRIIDSKPTRKKEVEAICMEMSPSMIIFDQIDKIEGFAADRNDLELKDLYAWARNLASQYGPAIAVCQAGGTGEGKQYLTMNDVDSSKTSKQGEADWILGIGQLHEFGKEQVRYLHLSKNKLFGDEDTDPSMRHGKWAVYIEPEVARYRDFNPDGTINRNQ